MTKVPMIVDKVAKIIENKDIHQALVGYILHLSNYPEDYAGATKEASYDLELGQEKDFKNALTLLV